MVKVTLLTLCLSAVFLPQLLLASKVSKELVKLAYREFLQQERVLFYIGRHIHTPHVVIWGQTALSEDMVDIFLNNQNDVGGMESLLRSQGNRWAHNYTNYRLSGFSISAYQQSDSMIRRAVKESDGLQLLNGYVEEVDIDLLGDILKLYDKDGVEVVPVEKNFGVECALYREGDACALLFHTLNEMSRAENISPQERIQQYLEAKGEKFFSEGGYIIVAEMAKDLGMRGSDVGQNLSNLKKKLPDGHFIRQIVSKKERIGEDKKIIYHLEGIEPLSPGQKKVKKHFEAKGEEFFLEGNHITLDEMVEHLGMKSGISVGNNLSNLKKKLPDGHFIHKIKSKKTEGKRVYYLPQE